jgi:hypothetical protein
VLNKDGSVRRSARFRGSDLCSAVAAELVAVASGLNNALRRLGSGWAIFAEAQRHQAASCPASHFADAACALVDANVTGDGVALGRIGRRPANCTPIDAIGSLNWDTPWQGLAVDIGFTHEGPRESTRLNLVRIPQRTLVNVGAGHAALARLTITNLFTVHGLRAPGAGAYDLIPGRVAIVSLTWDL